MWGDVVVLVPEWFEIQNKVAVEDRRRVRLDRFRLMWGGVGVG
jgi:hypothetical protein